MVSRVAEHERGGALEKRKRVCSCTRQHPLPAQQLCPTGWQQGRVLTFAYRPQTSFIHKQNCKYLPLLDPRCPPPAFGVKHEMTTCRPRRSLFLEPTEPESRNGNWQALESLTGPGRPWCLGAPPAHTVFGVRRLGPWLVAGSLCSQRLSSHVAPCKLNHSHPALRMAPAPMTVVMVVLVVVLSGAPFPGAA